MILFCCCVFYPDVEWGVPVTCAFNSDSADYLVLRATKNSYRSSHCGYCVLLLAAIHSLAQEDEEDRLAHIGACCRVLDLVHKGSRPGLKPHFVCQHGGYPPGTTCGVCEQETEQRAIAAFSGR